MSTRPRRSRSFPTPLRDRSVVRVLARGAARFATSPPPPAHEIDSRGTVVIAGVRVRQDVRIAHRLTRAEEAAENDANDLEGVSLALHHHRQTPQEARGDEWHNLARTLGKREHAATDAAERSQAGLKAAQRAQRPPATPYKAPSVPVVLPDVWPFPACNTSPARALVAHSATTGAHIVRCDAASLLAEAARAGWAVHTSAASLAK